MIGTSSLLSKQTHALKDNYLCIFGPKKPSPLLVPFQATKSEIESIYLSKCKTNDCILFANLVWSVDDAPSLFSSSLGQYISPQVADCGVGDLQDLQLHSVSPLKLTGSKDCRHKRRQLYLVASNEWSLCRRVLESCTSRD
jgi:hypothetical protein